MRLERVAVERLRGGSERFELVDLAPGLNLVFGPNGSGKSSLCAALRSMLWPDAGVVPDAEMVAWWRLDARPETAGPTLRAELHASGLSPVARVEWQSDGLPVDRPDVPSRELAAIYTLGLRDLLSDVHATDQELARRIRVEMAGGFDIAALRTRHTQQFGSRQEREWRDATEAFRQLEARRRQLAGEADRLDELREARDRAAAAQRDLEPLRAAVDAARLRDELAQLDRRRASLRIAPDLLDASRGDERELLRQLVEDLQSADAECAVCRRAVEELERARESLELPDLRPDASAQSKVRLLAAALRKAEGDRGARADQLAAARHAVEASARELSGGVEFEALAELDPTSLDPAEGWISRSIRNATTRSELLGKIESAGALAIRVIEAEADDARRRADALREWLASPVALPPRSRAGDWLLLSCGVALAVVSYWTSLWLLGPAGALLGAAAARLLEPVADGSGARPAIEARWRAMPVVGEAQAEGGYARLRFEAPIVREALAEIESRLADRLRQLAEAMVVEERRRELAHADAELADLTANRIALAKRFGIDPGLGVLAFSDLLDRVRRRRDAEAARDRIEGESARFESTVHRIRTELESVMPAAWVDPGRDVEMLAWLADDWIARIEKDATLCARLEEAREQERAARIRRDRIDVRRLALHSLVGADAEASEDEVDAQLGAFLVERSEHLEIARARRACLDRLSELDVQLDRHPGMRDASLDDAQARLEEATNRADEVARHAEEIARIEERVEMAVRSGELEARQADVDRALAELAAARDELAEELAGNFLLDEVEAEYERHTQPARLRVAGDLFARFTRHRHRLELEREGETGSFRAIDTETGRGLALGELSDGTRMQLLLAARLAFAIHAEGSQHPPIFLDEALTASDPERFSAVASALFELAAEGRQIFYLSCNPADVAMFEQLAAQAAVDRIAVFDLGRLRGRSAAFAETSRLVVPAPARVPAPGADEPDAYALRIGATRPLPGEGAERLHLFHVLRDDLPLLHRLLDEARIERIGHWHALRASPLIRSLVSDDERARVDAAVEVAERYIEAHAIGRGRRVDRAVLEGTDAVSESFIDRLSELARDLEGDAAAILAALDDKQVPNFRTSKIELLRRALEASGHLDPAEPLGAAALRVRALSRVPGSTWESSGCFDVAAAQRLIDSLERLFEPSV